MLNQYRVSEKELKDIMGIDLEEELEDITKKTYVLNMAFEFLVNEIFSLNDKINSRSEIENCLNDEEKVYVFKWCQCKIITNLLNYENLIIDDMIRNSIRFELRLSNINGFQK